MSTVYIQHKIKISLNGRSFISKINEKVKVDIKALNFKEEFSVHKADVVCYWLVPQMPSSAGSLHKIFPTEEWEYTFYVPEAVLHACYRPLLYLEISQKKGNDTIYLEFDDLTEEEYEYLRGFYCKLFEADILTLEEYYKSNLDFHLLDRDSGSPTGEGLSDLMDEMEDEDYRLIRDMFYDMRGEYMDGGSTSFNEEKLYAVINRELLAALVDRAKERTDTRKEETPTINGELFLTLRVAFNDMKTGGASTENGKIVIDDHDLLFDDILHNLGGAAQITEISSEIVSS